MPVPHERASDSDAWLVYAALRDYAVPVEKVVRTTPDPSPPVTQPPRRHP
jgi:hypothetical protein